jgi:hypothetical protein
MTMAAQQPDLDASSFIRKKRWRLVGVRERKYSAIFLSPWPFPVSEINLVVVSPVVGRGTVAILMTV